MRIDRRLAWACASLLASASLLIGAGGAGAGTVKVSPPFNPAAAYNYNGWSYGFGNFTMWLGPTGVGGNPVGAPGTYMWARTPDLPANVNLDAVYYSMQYQTATGAHPWGIRMCTRGSRVNPTGCGTADPADNYVMQPTGGAVWTRTNGITCHTTLGCDAMQLEVREQQNFGYMAFTGTAVTLRDNTAPNINAYAGGNWLTSGFWLRGSVDGTIYTYEDRGVGVRTSALKIDGATNQSTTYSCPNWNSWQPCPDSQWWSPFLDTTALADGPHNLVYETTDAANTTGATGNIPIKIDNTAPAAPAELEIAGDGLSGWSASNRFQASWQNGAEVAETATQSGLTKVRVDVEPTNPATQSNPAAVDVPIGGTAAELSATASTVAGITLPAKGMWRLRIQLVDRAGNASAVGEGTGSDATIGWSDGAPPKALGRANGWLSHDELLSGVGQQVWSKPQTAADEAPVCGYGVAVSEDQFDIGPANIVVREPDRFWPFPRTLTEGRHWVHIRSINCALQAAAATEHVAVDVDLTDPSASFSGVEEGRWYQDGRRVRLAGLDALSGMVGSELDEPVEAGAYIAHTLNGHDSDALSRGAETTIHVTGEGVKELIFAPVDRAGNRAAATTVRFGIDATAPVGSFAAIDPERPTLIRAPLSDALSGLDGALISVRRVGDGAWRDLPTSLADRSDAQAGTGPQRALAEARFPDAELPRGVYELRITAHDAAGNQLTSLRSEDGSSQLLVNPLRDATGLTAAAYRGLHRCRRMRRSRCVKKRRGRVFLVGGRTSTRVGWRRAGVVQGYLTTSDYAPLAGRRVEIHTKEPGRAEVLAGVAPVGTDGSYHFRIPPGVSRRVRVAFAGDELLRGTEAHASLATAAKLRLAVSRRHVRSGQQVTFRGRVIAADRTYPRAGKIVTLQFLTDGRWRPAVAIVRTGADGRFSVPYRFTRIPREVRARIRFRVYAPSETGFSHASSASRTRIVGVN